MRIAIVGRDSHERLTPREVADFLGTSTNVLHVWRCKGRGPAWRKGANGYAVEYRVDDVARWLNEVKPWTKPGLRKAWAA